MDREIFRRIIKENQEFIKEVELYKRHFDFEEKGKYVLVGIRHAGKSYLLYQRAKLFVENGHSVEEIAYINFDDERLSEMCVDDFDLILQAYNSMYAHKPIFFFDEIQNVTGWEHFARRLANQKYQVFITGSNAKMLARDISTTLGERYFTKMVYPFSFKEFLEFHNVILAPQWEYGKQYGDVNKYFNDYFYYGGFPESFDYKNKRNWLQGLYERIFFSDMVVRNRVKNEDVLRLSVKRLAECVKQPTSYTRISNLLKTVGYSTTTASVVDYVRFMRESCLIFSVENYSSKFVEKETVKKHYFIDNGILNLFLTDPETFLLENICAIHLYKQYGNDLYFYKHNVEVDFYIPDMETAIQVSYSVSDNQTLEREINALLKLDSAFRLRTMLIITRDEEKSIPLKNGKVIHVVPIWKWLLL